jgi:MFS family permease
VRPFLLLNLVGTGMALLGLALTDWLPAWFVLRLILGACLAGLFVVSEAWINHLADDRSRGRVLGIYSSVLAAGFTIGPLLLQVTGVEGILPFLAGLGFLAVAAIPLSLVGGEDPPLSGHPSRGVMGFAAAAPIATSAALVFGAIEAGVLSLLPVYGVRSGLTPESAAAMAAAIGMGNFAMQVPLGWLADRTNVRWMLVACALAGLGGALPNASQGDDLEEVVAGNHLAQAEADLPHCCQRLAALLAGPAAERRLYGVKRSDALPHRQPVLPAGQFGDEDEEAELRDPATTVEDVLRLLATQHGRCAHCLVRALLA